MFTHTSKNTTTNTTTATNHHPASKRRIAKPLAVGTVAAMLGLGYPVAPALAESPPAEPSEMVLVLPIEPESPPMTLVELDLKAACDAFDDFLGPGHGCETPDPDEDDEDDDDPVGPSVTVPGLDLGICEKIDLETGKDHCKPVVKPERPSITIPDLDFCFDLDPENCKPEAPEIDDLVNPTIPDDDDEDGEEGGDDGEPTDGEPTDGEPTDGDQPEEDGEPTDGDQPDEDTTPTPEGSSGTDDGADGSPEDGDTPDGDDSATPADIDTPRPGNPNFTG